MGLYDSFVDKCPYCGAQTEVQTKLLECFMGIYRKGDPIDLPDGDLKLKGGCLDCNKPLVASIFEKTFMGFTKRRAQHEELPWGGVRQLDEEE